MFAFTSWKVIFNCFASLYLFGGLADGRHSLGFTWSIRLFHLPVFPFIPVSKAIFLILWAKKTILSQAGSQPNLGTILLFPGLGLNYSVHLVKVASEVRSQIIKIIENFSSTISLQIILLLSLCSYNFLFIDYGFGGKSTMFTIKKCKCT